MKKLFLFLALATTLVTYSQKKLQFKGRKKPYTCESIVEIKNELSGKYEERLPNEFILSPINFSHIKTDSAEVNLLSFYIERYPYSSSVPGVFFKLESGEVIKFQEERVRTSYVAGSYSLMANLIMDVNLIETLKNNFVVQFSMGDQIVELDELHMRNLKSLFNCMFN